MHRPFIKDALGGLIMVLIGYLGYELSAVAFAELVKAVKSRIRRVKGAVHRLIIC